MSPKPTLARILAGFVCILGLLIVITGRAQTLAEAVPATCRTLHLCSPMPPDDIQNFESGWSSGSSFNAQVAQKLSDYRAKYPDFDIQAVQTGEDEQHDFPNRNYQYKYRGRFVVTPKWKGLFAMIGDIIHTSKLMAGLLTLTILGAAIVVLSPRGPKRQTPAL